jgi:hypothetical protein
VVAVLAGTWPRVGAGRLRSPLLRPADELLGILLVEPPPPAPAQAANRSRPEPSAAPMRLFRTDAMPWTLFDF